MSRSTLIGSPDKVLIFWLLLYLAVTCALVPEYGGGVYLILTAVAVFAGSVLYLLSVRRRQPKAFYYRYILLVGFVPGTIHLWHISHAPLLILLYTGLVIVFAAVYLQPSLIWFVFGVYAVCSPLVVPLDIFIVDPVEACISYLIGICFVLALHLICWVCRERITVIQRLEREHNFERLGQQQHLATIGQIAASIAHDIRNPLTSIQGFVQLIEKDERRSSYQQYFSIIRSEIGRIDALLREVLKLSKMHTVDTDSWTQVHLGALLQRLVLLMQPDALKSNIQMNLWLHDHPSVESSEEKLQQVFMNVLRNAFEAVRENGRIDIEVLLQAGEAVVNIRDSGPGIPPEQLEHLFTPFFTTKTEGTGLGLSICQSIIRSYGGAITVQNLPEKGAQFTITLPV